MTTGREPERPGPRVPQLDILRGVAILLVIGRHMRPPTADVAAPVRAVASVWHQVGWTGVDLFFVLSGFLVSGLLFTEYQKHGALRIGRFLIRRGFKIYPPFYVFLGATLLVEAWRSGLTGEVSRQLAAEAVYLQGYVARFWSHTWSLAVEEHFYVLLPLVLLALVRRRGSLERSFRALALIVGATALAAFILRVLGWASYQKDYGTYLYSTHLRLDSLAWGVLVSYLYHFRRAQLLAVLQRRGVVIAVASVALIALPFFMAPDAGSLFIFGLLFLAWGFVGLMLCALARPVGLPLRLPESVGTPLAHLLGVIGFYSYSIYLWHLPVREWGIAHMRRAGFFEVAPPRRRTCSSSRRTRRRAWCGPSSWRG